MIKVDTQKVYDSVEWPFLEQVLTNLNFPAMIVDWIMKCISNVSYSIIINRKPSSPFPGKKGLGQGDSLSLFLFVIAIEYLNKQLKTLRHNPNFNFYPKCSKLQIIQLGFVDDLLLFLVEDMWYMLSYYSNASLTFLIAMA